MKSIMTEQNTHILSTIVETPGVSEADLLALLSVYEPTTIYSLVELTQHKLIELRVIDGLRRYFPTQKGIEHIDTTE